MSKLDKEAIEVLVACNRELEKESFNDYLTKEKYRIAKSTIAGKSNHCRYCCYCEYHIRCMVNIKQRVEKGLCWKAMNRYLLIKEELYGTQVRT